MNNDVLQQVDTSVQQITEVEKTQWVGRLTSIINTTLVISTIVFQVIYLIFLGFNSIVTVLLTIAIGLTFVVKYLIDSNRVEIAAFLLTSNMLIIMFFGSLIAGDFPNPVMIAFLLVIIISGIILEPKSATILSLLTIAAVCILFVIDLLELDFTFGINPELNSTTALLVYIYIIVLSSGILIYSILFKNRILEQLNVQTKISKKEKDRALVQNEQLKILSDLGLIGVSEKDIAIIVQQINTVFLSIFGIEHIVLFYIEKNKMIFILGAACDENKDVVVDIQEQELPHHHDIDSVPIDELFNEFDKQRCKLCSKQADYGFIYPIYVDTEIVGIFQVRSQNVINITQTDKHFIQSIVAILSIHIERRRNEQRRVEEAEKIMLAQKMQALGRMAGAIAHDFNNLLTAIFGYAELAQMEISEQQVVEDSLDEIIKAGDRAKEFIEGLLAISKKQKLSVENITLDHTIGDMQGIYNKLVDNDVKLHFDLQAGDVAILADSGQMSQVLINLITNSNESIGGGGTITISTRLITNTEFTSIFDETPTVPEFVLLDVEDDGSGISAKDLPFIFDPFFTTKKHGVGMGLSTVYGLIKQIDGSITVFSSDQGTIFRIAIPVSAISSTPEKKTLAHQSNILNKTILLVDDEPQILSVLGPKFENAGYKVLRADNGEEALEILSSHNHSIDIMLTDIVMTDMSGTDLAQLSTQLRPDMFIIFMSGYPKTDLMTSFNLSLDADEVPFIQKPFKFRELHDYILTFF